MFLKNALHLKCLNTVHYSLTGTFIKHCNKATGSKQQHCFDMYGRCPSIHPTSNATEEALSASAALSCTAQDLSSKLSSGTQIKLFSKMDLEQRCLQSTDTRKLLLSSWWQDKICQKHNHEYQHVDDTAHSGPLFLPIWNRVGCTHTSHTSPLAQWQRQKIMILTRFSHKVQTNSQQKY